MNFKLLLLPALAFSFIKNTYTICPFGSCPLTLRKIAVHRVVRPVNRPITGYHVRNNNISLKIHLTDRNMNYFTFNRKYVAPIKYVAFRNSFSTRIHYGNDITSISIVDGRYVNIEIKAHNNKHFVIKSMLPHPIRNILGRVQIKMYGNIIEVIMPKF